MIYKDFESKLTLIENELYKPFGSYCEGQSAVAQAMRYTLESGGKRIRPVLTLEFAESCGGKLFDALPFACAVEYVHTYSLIHDDLPCMDDDDLRRGRASCHKVYGEANALLAGDGLLTLAFSAIAFSEASADRIKTAVAALSHYAGIDGMIGGQAIDLYNEGKNADIESLGRMDALKTGALITAACELGCIAAGAGDAQTAAAKEYASCVGLAFQIKDDILDVTGDVAVLGKKTGSDGCNDKSTYVSLLGLDECSRTVEELTERAVSALDVFGGRAEKLKALAVYLAEREK
ncbi:MAG: polyprenyl synthetase family protein [Clostridiales bacterium]|nr:polyprenyl synthetase family protein [Clostridiales bacterium]